MKRAYLRYSIALLLPLVFLSGCSEETDSAAAAGAGGGSDGNLGPSTPTGRITADGFYILYNPAVPAVFDEDRNFQQQEVTVTVFADDVNDLVVLSGQTVNFRTEWGSFIGTNRDSCVIQNGECSVTWRSGDPGTAPQDCRVAITAWATGEEAFFDANDNNQFDQSETLIDLEEPFLSINTNVNDSFDAAVSTFEGVGELIDIADFDGSTGKNGAHDSGDNLYTGTLCASGNTRCSGRTSMIIHYRSEILIQDPFDEPSGEDTNGNGTPEEQNINFCNGASY